MTEVLTVEKHRLTDKACWQSLAVTGKDDGLAVGLRGMDAKLRPLLVS